MCFPEPCNQDSHNDNAHLLLFVADSTGSTMQKAKATPACSARTRCRLWVQVVKPIVGAQHLGCPLLDDREGKDYGPVLSVQQPLTSFEEIIQGVGTGHCILANWEEVPWQPGTQLEAPAPHAVAAGS